MTSDKERERHRRNHIKNRTKRLTQMREYYWKNRDKILAQRKKWGADHRNYWKNYIAENGRPDLVSRTVRDLTKAFLDTYIPERTKGRPPGRNPNCLSYNLRKRAVLKLGGKCANCTCKELDILQINHKNGWGAREMRERGETNYHLYRSILLGERNDLDVRCIPCNALHYVSLIRPEIAEHFRIIYSEAGA